MEKRERIQSIDALRGVCLILMVAYHFFYDLVYFFGAPVWILSNPVFNVLQPFFAGVFIALSGVSARFSRSNTKRGIKVLAVSLLVTGVTSLMGSPVIFGILHLLGFCMVFYGLTGKLWDKLPEKAAPVIYIALIIVLAVFIEILNPVNIDGLWIFGFYRSGFYSSDYFPILPWIFVFLLGTWLGKLVTDRKLPDWIYSVNPPVVPAIGRKSLLIYVLHQPVLYGITMLIRAVIS